MPNIWMIMQDETGKCKICKREADKHDPKETRECYEKWHFLYSDSSLKTDIDY